MRRSATRTFTMCAFPRVETRLPSWCRSATQEQPSRLRRPSTSTPPLQPLQDSSLPFLLGTQRLTRRILRPAIIDPLVFTQHSMTPPLHVSRTPVSCTHFDDKPYDPPSLGSYGAPSKVEDKVLGDVHGSMANVTGCHGSCHGSMLRKGPSLLVCHGVTGRRGGRAERLED